MSFLLAAPIFSYAQGYQVALQGNAQLAMGHAGTALKMDASSVFFNPGAVAMLERNEAQVGGNFIFSRTTFVSQQNETFKSNNPTGTPFHAYGVYGADGSKLKFGVGVYTPFGSSVNWGDQWAGRFQLNSISLRTICYQPTISYKLSDQISFGAGLIIATGSVNLQRSIGVNFPDGTYGRAELNGNAIPSYGLNAGIYIQATDKLSVGLSYRSKMLMRIDGGDAKFNVPASFTTANNLQIPAATTFKAELPLPETFNVGAAYQVNEKLLVTGDVNYVVWSSYQTLDFDYAQNAPLLQDTQNPRNYQDAFIFRGGAQYQYTDKLALRGGLYYATTAVPDNYITPETPDANRTGLTAGIGYRVNDNIVLDASFLYLNVAKRTDFNSTTNFGGTYKTHNFIPGIGVRYQF